MAEPVSVRKKLPLIPIAICFVVAIGLIIALLFLSGPVTKPVANQPASPDAQAYVRNLALSDVKMQAAENLMQQRVVEITGKITNNGPRPLQSVDVYCLFYDVGGHEVYRERLPIVRAKSEPLEAHQTRAFRLPFDSLPDAWNQAMPKLVIAHISFAG